MLHDIPCFEEWHSDIMLKKLKSPFANSSWLLQITIKLSVTIHFIATIFVGVLWAMLKVEVLEISIRCLL